jgi:type IX secretion system PorP/SprF family membrane protein
LCRDVLPSVIFGAITIRMKNSLRPRFLLLLALHCSLITIAFAQQDAQYSMYRFNGLYLNPAYAGSHEVLTAMAIYRQQWVGMPGAPKSASVAVHSPLKNDKIGLGLIYNYDGIGVTKTNDLNLSFAYRLPIGKKKKVRLSFGLSAGITNYHSAMDNVATTDANDPNFVGNSVNRWLPNFGFGVYAYSDRFFAGISVPHILANKLDGKNSVFETSSSVARQYHHLLVTAGYVFPIGKKVKFMPSALLKYMPGHAPITFDFNATFIFIERVWIGAGYRFNDSYNFMLAANVTRQLRIGYCYDITVSSLNRYNTGSHEVMASFDFDFAHRKIVSPRQVKYF